MSLLESLTNWWINKEVSAEVKPRFERFCLDFLIYSQLYKQQQKLIITNFEWLMVISRQPGHPLFSNNSLHCYRYEP